MTTSQSPVSQRSQSQSPSSLPSQEPHVERWRNRWTLFQRALRSHDEFDAWYWVCQLGAGLADYLYHALRIHHVVHFFQLQTLWRPLTPAIAIVLILFTLCSYFVSLRIHLIRHRWCPSMHHSNATTVLGVHGTPGESCTWEYVHTTIVTYLGIMILYTYIGVIFESPGVAIPLRDGPTEYRWKAIHSQGGFLGWDATVDIAAERRRVEAYGPALLMQQDDDDNNTASEYPTTNFTFCKKCDTWRPPRCHHCSTCRRCVLQMDHHCPWVNNCIGYNNIRTFILSLIFLVLGCWYGVFVLAMPFFELIRHQVAAHGWKLIYRNGTGFLDLPGPSELLYQMISGSLPPDVWIKMVFPLLTGVGTVLTVFLAFHIKYVVSAHTTLENTIVLTNMRTEAMDVLRRRSTSGDTIVRPTNPFDQGWKKNVLQILGPNLLGLLLPIRLDSPPPPFVPPPKSKSMRNCR